MSNIREFPKDKSTDSLKSFWEISNPNRPDIAPQRIEHNESILHNVTDEYKIAIFIPRKVAEYLNLEINNSNKIKIAVFGRPNIEESIKAGPISLRWLGSMSEIELSAANPELFPKKEASTTDAFIWDSKSYIALYKEIR